MEEVRENCGICVTHTLHDAYNFMSSQQHRGREAAGITGIDDESIMALKWTGPVNRFSIKALHRIFKHGGFHTFLGHIRYATQGRKDKLLEDAHPHTIGGREERHEDHVFVYDCDAAAVHNGHVSREHWEGSIDEKVLKTGCDTEAILHYYYLHGERDLIEKIPGSYTIALADKRKKEVIVLRDRFGIRPGVLGIKDGKYCAASETRAFLQNGAAPVSDLTPGAAHYFDAHGGFRAEEIAHPRLRHCFFEYNYIGHESSTINGVSVQTIRRSIGEALAEEFSHCDADVVTYMPECPEQAALIFAQKRRLPFLHVFYKKQEERAFQGSTPEERRSSISGNLFIIPTAKKEIQGKTVIVIDDSTVRGTNAARARHLLYEEAGAKNVCLLNYTPPIGILGQDGVPRGCMFGVDMPPDDHFIARGRTLQEISKEVGMGVDYISTEKMLRVFEHAGIPSSKLCTYCIGGDHPFE